MGVMLSCRYNLSRQPNSKVLKTTSVAVSATTGVSTTTFCHDGTDSRCENNASTYAPAHLILIHLRTSDWLISRSTFPVTDGCLRAEPGAKTDQKLAFVLVAP